MTESPEAITTAQRREGLKEMRGAAGARTEMRGAGEAGAEMRGAGEAGAEVTVVTSRGK